MNYDKLLEGVNGSAKIKYQLAAISAIRRHFHRQRIALATYEAYIVICADHVRDLGNARQEDLVDQIKQRITK